jgi:hypothetical protein
MLGSIVTISPVNPDTAVMLDSTRCKEEEKSGESFNYLNSFTSTAVSFQHSVICLRTVGIDVLRCDVANHGPFTFVKGRDEKLAY